MDIDSEDVDTAPTWRGFPGGHARLPRLTRAEADDGPEIMFVESAFLREPSAATRRPYTDSGFEAYYSADSLFEEVPGLLEEADPFEGPYEILGLGSGASWEEISRAHRSLVSELHPDRYVNADEVVREAAERRVRDVNEAYATIRRERAGRGR